MSAFGRETRMQLTARKVNAAVVIAVAYWLLFRGAAVSRLGRNV